MIEIVVIELEKKKILEKYEKIILSDVNYGDVNLSELEIIRYMDKIIYNSKNDIIKKNNIIKEKQDSINEFITRSRSLVEEIIRLNNLCNEKNREIKILTDKLNKLENEKSNKSNNDVLPVIKMVNDFGENNYIDFKMIDYKTRKDLTGTFKDYYKSWEEYLKFLDENSIPLFYRK